MVLNVSAGGIVNTRVFSVMVIMCIFTISLTFPLVQWLYPEHFITMERARSGS